MAITREKRLSFAGANMVAMDRETTTVLSLKAGADRTEMVLTPSSLQV